jgi:hypothetical protein
LETGFACVDFVCVAVSRGIWRSNKKFDFSTKSNKKTTNPGENICYIQLKRDKDALGRVNLSNVHGEILEKKPENSKKYFFLNLKYISKKKNPKILKRQN